MHLATPVIPRFSRPECSSSKAISYESRARVQVVSCHPMLPPTGHAVEHEKRHFRTTNTWKIWEDKDLSNGMFVHRQVFARTAVCPYFGVELWSSPQSVSLRLNRSTVIVEFLFGGGTYVPMENLSPRHLSCGVTCISISLTTLKQVLPTRHIAFLHTTPRPPSPLPPRCSGACALSCKDFVFLLPHLVPPSSVVIFILLLFF